MLKTFKMKIDKTIFSLKPSKFRPLNYIKIYYLCYSIFIFNFYYNN